MTKRFRILLALFLALLMAAMVPLQASASIVKKEYISDLKIVQGKADQSKYDVNGDNAGKTAEKDAEKQLNDAGYKMVSQPLDATMYVYLGYKTTTDPTQAITDISAMNMRGGYTMADYASVTAQLKKQWAEGIAYFYNGIKEFCANYHAGSPAAQYAYQMLNKYKDDDSGQLMGDYFLNESLTEDDILKILMETTGAVSGTLKQYICVGCVPYGNNPDGTAKENWMKRLSKNGPDDNLGDEYGDRAAVLAEKLQPIQENLQQYLQDVEQYGADATQDSLSSVMNDTEMFDYSDRKALYSILSSYTYGTGTLADLILNLNEFDLYPMVKVLTEAEYDMIYIWGIKVFIQCGTNTKDVWDNLAASSNSTMESQGMTDPISIYTGVNRALMKGNVALTDRAQRDTNIYGQDYNWFEESTVSTVLKYTLFGVAALTIGSYLWCWGSKLAGGEGFGRYVIDFFPAGEPWNNEVMIRSINKGMQTSEFSRTVFSSTTRFISSAAYVVFKVALAALAIIGLVYGIMDLVAQYAVEQTPIPGVMYDSATSGAGVVSMIRYDALTNLQGVPTDTQYGVSGNQWVELYTTTDRAAGDPITTDMFLSTANQAAASYVPVHMFGETASFSITGNKDIHYLFFTRDANAFVTGSAFSDGYLGIAAGIGLIVGLVAGGFGGAAIYRKKKRKAAVAEIPAE